MSISRVTIGNPTKASDINAIIPLIIRKSISHVITDTGGREIYIVSPTAGSTITITLPTMGANVNRELTFIHGTTAAGLVKIDGEGSELINGSSYVYMRSKYDSITIIGSSVEWSVK